MNLEAKKLVRYGVLWDQGRHVWLGSPHDPMFTLKNSTCNEGNIDVPVCAAN